MPPIIEVEHVTKEFMLGSPPSLKQTALNALRRLTGQPVEERQPFKALDDVHFCAQRGEVLGIIGHNGAGKSTLLKILASISEPTRGKVTVRGRVAPLIEVGAGLIPDMTGRENIFLNAAILGMKRAEIKRRFEEIVAFAELEEFIDTPTKRYSSGMRVRLGFAIATSVASEILIVDEVLAVGDMAFQRKCVDRMETLIKNEGRTVLLVSHDIRHLERLCERAVLLDHGRVAMDADAKTTCDAFINQSNAKIIATRGVGGGLAQANALHDAVTLLGIEILDAAGSPTRVAEPNGSIAARLLVQVNEQLRDATVGIGVHTPDLLFLATVNTEDHLQIPVLSVGLHEITCTIPKLPLVPGPYALRVGITTGASAHTVYYGEHLASFQVQSSVARRLSAANRDGFLALEASWALKMPPEIATSVPRQTTEVAIGAGR